MDDVRIGFVGAGSVAARHVASLRRLEGINIVAVTDAVADRAQEFAFAADAAAFADLDTMLGGIEIDAAYVCVPPFAHGAVEYALVEAGVPLFVEKPLALDISTAETIAAEIERTSLVTATGYHWRYYDTVERAGELLSGHSVGLAVGSWLDRVPPPPWWRDASRSGGPVIEQATHVLDLLRVLVGEVVSVHALGARLDRGLDGDVDDASVATLRFANGAVGSLLSTSLLGWKHWAGVELYADGVALRLAEDVLELLQSVEGRTRWQPQVDAKSAADREFVAAVRSGDPTSVRVPYAEALHTHRLACAVAEAVRCGTVVQLGQQDGRYVA
jgi:myo-inositol 2-dehydrogenase / D-chiro-inositol 1-dehydrogenase